MLENATFYRLGFFIGIFCIMALLESLFPRRERLNRRLQRWPSNFAIIALGGLAGRFLLPFVPVGFAVIAQEQGWGLFNSALTLPFILSLLVSVVLFDLAIYAQHVAFHKVPVLWRLHRMHHADTDIDVTTGARFHPLEIWLSLIIKMVLIVALGAPPEAVLVFEIALNATAIFNHANVRLPEKLDAFLRLFLVTPDFHRVHHSVIPTETNSNYGFNLAIWDRLFGTYIAQPEAGHEGMQIGLSVFRNPKWLRMDKLLILPFVNRE